ncbi:uncharacterized protein LOC110037632 [Phalaenopsis equestris]|uniref:uncharacterized protein LOC110037632 n=1 Tax=Phalaenopsis equestris TaxID=78828 RepID=UPI0009E1BDB0|nr:uncharacterized protein LOC110037632 [Phalaenopsis equestris]
MKTKKSKAKACLFAAVSSKIFTRIMSLKTTKGIWDYLKSSMKEMKEFEGCRFKDCLQILVTVPERFEATITTSKNMKDLSKIALTELLSALQTQEQSRVMRQEGVVEGALPVKHQDDEKNRRSKNKKF